MRLRLLLGAMGLGVATMAVTADDARACGGCFHGPSQNGDVITDHRMIFRVTPEQTTLYDEIEYQGNPQSFAWVLPDPRSGAGGPELGRRLRSARPGDADDHRVAQSSRVPFLLVRQRAAAGFGSSSGSSGGGAADASAGVSVISQQVVGPYDTVQLQSTESERAHDLADGERLRHPDRHPAHHRRVRAGGVRLPRAQAPARAGRAGDAARQRDDVGRGPLAAAAHGRGGDGGHGRRHAVGHGRGALRGRELPELRHPARRSSSGTGTLETSNYTTLRQQKERPANFATWQTESSLDIYAVPGREARCSTTSRSQDYLPIPGSDAGGDGGAGQTADQVRQADLATLFPGGDQDTVRITRMRADLAHAALASDLALQASADQSDLSNFYQVTQSVNAPAVRSVAQPVSAVRRQRQQQQQRWHLRWQQQRCLRRWRERDALGRPPRRVRGSPVGRAERVARDRPRGDDRSGGGCAARLRRKR